MGGTEGKTKKEVGIERLYGRLYGYFGRSIFMGGWDTWHGAVRGVLGVGIQNTTDVCMGL